MWYLNFVFKCVQSCSSVSVCRAFFQRLPNIWRHWILLIDLSNLIVFAYVIMPKSHDGQKPISVYQENEKVTAILSTQEFKVSKEL